MVVRAARKPGQFHRPAFKIQFPPYNDGKQPAVWAVPWLFWEARPESRELLIGCTAVYATLHLTPCNKSFYQGSLKQTHVKEIYSKLSNWMKIEDKHSSPHSPVILSLLKRLLRWRWILRLLMDMLLILPTDLPTMPTMLTDALLIRLKLLKKLSDIELCVLLAVRFCILISYWWDQTPDTDLIVSWLFFDDEQESFCTGPLFSRFNNHLLSPRDFPLTSPLFLFVLDQIIKHPRTPGAGRPFGFPPQMLQCPNPVSCYHKPTLRPPPFPC